MANGEWAVPALADALGRLDQDIEDAERRLAELRAMRASIQPFIERYVGTSHAPEQPEQAAETGSISYIAEVLKVFHDHPGEVLDVDDAWEYVEENVGGGTARDSVRNAINYAVRQGTILRDSQRRGRYILKGTSTPVVAGVDVNEESDSEGSSGEIGGGRDYGSVRLGDQGGDAPHAQIHLDHSGDRAPIGG